MRISRGDRAGLGAAALLSSLRIFAADTGAGAVRPTGRDHGHRREARRNPAERTVVDDHFRRRGAGAKGHQHLLRLRHQGAESGLRAHRRRRRHRAHRSRSAGFRATTSRATTSTTRRCRTRSIRESWTSITSRYCADRRAPCTAHARWADWCASSPRQPDLNKFGRRRCTAGLSSTERTDRAELDRRRRGEYPHHRGQGGAAAERVLRLRGRLLQAQLLHRSGHRRCNLTCTPLATSGITTVNNVGAIDTYGGAASLTVKLNDSVTITPEIHAAANRLQRFSDGGLPLDAEQRDRLPGPVGTGYNRRRR